MMEQKEAENRSSVYSNESNLVCVCVCKTKPGKSRTEAGRDEKKEKT